MISILRTVKEFELIELDTNANFLKLLKQTQIQLCGSN